MYYRSPTLRPPFNAQRPGLRASAQPPAGAVLRVGCALRPHSAVRRWRWTGIARLRAAAPIKDHTQWCTTIARRTLNGMTPPARRARRPACRPAAARPPQAAGVRGRRLSLRWSQVSARRSIRLPMHWPRWARPLLLARRAPAMRRLPPTPRLRQLGSGAHARLQGSSGNSTVRWA